MRIFSIIIAFFFSIATWGQVSRLNFITEIGCSYYLNKSSSFVNLGTPVSLEKSYSGAIFSPGIGISYNLVEQKKVNFSVGLQFKRDGYSTKIYNFFEENFIKAKLTSWSSNIFSSFDINLINLKGKPRQFSAIGGVFISTPISVKWKYGNDPTQNVKSTFSKFTYGIIVGGQYIFGRKNSLPISVFVFKEIGLSNTRIKGDKNYTRRAVLGFKYLLSK